MFLITSFAHEVNLGEQNRLLRKRKIEVSWCEFGRLFKNKNRTLEKKEKDWT